MCYFFFSGAFFSIFAQVSFNVTVRLKTRCLRSGVRVHAEVAQPFELIAAAGSRIRQTRLQFASGQDLHRLRIQIIGELVAFFDVIRVFFGEQRFVNPNLGVNRVLRRNPMDGRFHFAAVRRRVAAACFRIVGAVNFHHFPCAFFTTLVQVMK